MKAMKLGMYFTYVAVLASQLLAQGPARNAWGVGATDRIFRYSGTAWTEVPGGILTHVCLAQDGSVWAVTRQGEIFRRTATDWERMPGSLAQIAVASERNVWGVNAGNEIYQWNGQFWTRIAGVASGITAASDGTVWALAPDGSIYQRVVDRWQQISGQLAQISAGNATTVWGVSGGNAVYRFVPASGGWDRMPGVMKQVSVAADGEVWGISAANELLRWDGAAWASLGQTLTQVTIGAPVTPAAGGRIEETSPDITFTGAWMRQTDAAASGGSHMISGGTGATATFRFTGDSVTLYRRMDTDGGQMNVSVDNRAVGTVSCYFRERRWQVPAVLDGLGAGNHTIVLTVSDRQPRGSTGIAVSVDAFESPAAVTVSTLQQRGADRTNVVRGLMGVPLARSVLVVNLAAQAHADYLATNRLDDHQQTPGLPGFVGIDPSDRLSYFGYDAGGGENITSALTPEGAVDSWLATIYHRNLLVDYNANEIGFGKNGTNPLGTYVMNLGGRQAAPPAARLLATYPADNQTQLPTSWSGNEAPLPLPDKQRPFGYPISLYITQAANATRGTDTAATSAALTNDAGQDVPFYFMDSQSDPRLANGTYFIQPQTPLAGGTMYQARITGTDPLGNRFEKVWRFTTRPAATIVNPTGRVNGNEFRLTWFTEGPVVSTQVEYGTTPAYGQTATPNPANSRPFFVSVPGLAPGLYHYKITAMDNKGNTRSTDNLTFTIP